MRNCKTIMQGLAEVRTSERSLSSMEWLSYSEDLNLFLAEEHDLLADMETTVAELRLAILRGQEKTNVSACEIEVDASPEKNLLRKQKFFVERIEQQILLAKKRAGMDL